jgi:hypothetical protein
LLTTAALTSTEALKIKLMGGEVSETCDYPTKRLLSNKGETDFQANVDGSTPFED